MSEHKNEEKDGIDAKNVTHEFQTIKARPVTLEDDYVFYNYSFISRLATIIVIILMKIFIEIIFARIFLGFRVKGRKNFRKVKKEGLVLIGNHIHPTDAILVGTTIFPRKLSVTMLMTNLGIPFAGPVLKQAGGVPLPVTKVGLSNFISQTNKMLKNGHKLLVMPEAALKPYNVGIRKFYNGAFRFAVAGGVKVLPLVFVYKKPRFLMKFIKKKPNIHLHFLPAMTITQYEKNAETIQNLKKEVHQAMNDYFNKHSEIK